MDVLPFSSEQLISAGGIYNSLNPQTGYYVIVDSVLYLMGLTQYMANDIMQTHCKEEISKIVLIFQEDCQVDPLKTLVQFYSSECILTLSTPLVPRDFCGNDCCQMFKKKDLKGVTKIGKFVYRISLQDGDIIWVIDSSIFKCSKVKINTTLNPDDSVISIITPVISQKGWVSHLTPETKEKIYLRGLNLKDEASYLDKGLKTI